MSIFRNYINRYIFENYEKILNKYLIDNINISIIIIILSTIIIISMRDIIIFFFRCTILLIAFIILIHYILNICYLLNKRNCDFEMYSSLTEYIFMKLGIPIPEDINTIKVCVGTKINNFNSLFKNNPSTDEYPNIESSDTEDFIDKYSNTTTKR